MNTRKKRIVICCDDGWNRAQNLTNVARIARSIKSIGADGKRQVVFYDRQTSSDNLFERLTGGAFSHRIEQKIQDAYRFVATHFVPGDELYCFGFSYGAYVVRALGGMLHTIGLLPKAQLYALERAYRYWRTPEALRQGQAYRQTLRPEIQVMAVWDTVGTSGVPVPLIRRLSQPVVGFFDTRLSPGIKHAYQALALDERRAAFAPGLWRGTINRDQTVEQVWFPGSHRDIGGGYTESGLSDNALMWMIEKTAALGLTFDQHYVANPKHIHGNVRDVLHDAYGWFYRLVEMLGLQGEGIRLLQGDGDNPPLNLSLHESVIERICKVDGYQPLNLSANLAVSRTDELRHFARVPTPELWGTIYAGGHSLGCEILDYSPTCGVRVQSASALDQFKVLSISSAKFAKTLATCVWKKDNHYGLSFAA